MKDQSLKYSEAYIREKAAELKRDFHLKFDDLQRHHEQAVSRWHSHPTLRQALDAAYREEMETLQKTFRSSANELQEELNSLFNADTHPLRRHLDALQRGVQDIFRMINRATMVGVSVALLSPKNFFE